MAETISIDLTQQEQLLIAIRALVDSAKKLETELASAILYTSNVATQGKFYTKYIAEKESTIQRFTGKAGAFLALTQALYTHTQETHRTLIDVDKLIALDIANSILGQAGTDEATKQQIRSDPNRFVQQLANEGKVGDEQMMKFGISEKSDYLMNYHIVNGEP
ncbi:MAG: hypothetical protein PUH12_03870 [Lachnospiraceae bacterium]|nr:hypothetical protein [Lachnospiraceae bacterium]